MGVEKTGILGSTEEMRHERGHVLPQIAGIQADSGQQKGIKEDAGAIKRYTF